MAVLDISIKSVSGTGKCYRTHFHSLLLTFDIAYTLQVDSTKTVGHIKTLLREQDSSIHPTASSLVYAGKSLDDAKTLEECDIINESTLHYSSGNNNNNNTLSVATVAPTEVNDTSISAVVAKTTRKTRKQRCSAKNCISVPLRNVGDCSYCEGRFCSKHRLLEQHQCIGLKNCKEQLHE